ncbi:MAG TPA: ROK family transcriptional regulator [Chitinophagaceae bacterium]|nr:ROK family transcriptional regulator [Chitinophagaceae bacterium]
MGKIEFYKGLILKEFYFSGHLSCADLSEKIGKSLPLTMKIVNELMNEGIVVESGYAPSSGGRRPVMYTVKADTIYIVAVAMDQLVTRISIMNMHNDHVGDIAEFELPLQRNPTALTTLGEKIVQVIDSSGVEKKKIIGVGIGMPGFIDFKKGTNYSFLETTDKTITQYLSDKIGLPVYIDNDSSLIALAELRFGAAQHKKNAMVINIGWGVGLGMILNGELFRGHNGFAGEFSHIPLFNNNKMCVCGKSGCLETEASLLVVIEKAGTELQEGRVSGIGQPFPTGHFEQDWKIIITAALKGDQFAVELLSDSGYKIGKGVAILVHVINPESVILSGRGALAGKLWQAPIQQALNEHCIPRLALNTSIEVSTLGYQAELIGAAALVLENRMRDHSQRVGQERQSFELGI